MSKSLPPWRKIVAKTLEELASEEFQLTYEVNVPIANVPSEMLCFWFSDAYHPDDANFCSCFDSDELNILAAFNEFFDLRVEQLPKSGGTIHPLLASPICREIMREAKQTRARIAA